MYDNNDALMCKLDTLEGENTRLKQDLGYFGFFGNLTGYGFGVPMNPSVIERRKKVDDILTVREWNTINNMSLNYSREEITDVLKILNKLVDAGVFDINTPPFGTPFYSPYSTMPPKPMMPVPNPVIGESEPNIADDEEISKDVVTKKDDDFSNEAIDASFKYLNGITGDKA